MKRIDLNDVAVVTYTNSRCHDVLDPYLHRLAEHCPWLKSYVLSNEEPSFCHGKLLQYDESTPYWQQWHDALAAIPETWIVYCQEDFILYKDVDQTRFQWCLDNLACHPVSFCRLLKAQFSPRTGDRIDDNLYTVDHSCEDIFHMQATIWKKSEFMRLYEASQSQLWFESPAFRDAARAIGIKGMYYHCGEPKRGKYHHDSAVWPYVATAINRGLWNTNEYPSELRAVFDEFGIDPLVRGTRAGYNYNQLTAHLKSKQDVR